MRAEPVDLPGFTVAANRVSTERIERQLRLMLGVSLKSMRYAPIRFGDIQGRLARGHNLEDLMRWNDTAGLIVRFTSDGPCFSKRGRGCLAVYLNGSHINREFMGDVPLDMLHTIVVVTPTDLVMQYGRGAVLLYTEAWLR